MRACYYHAGPATLGRKAMPTLAADKRRAAHASETQPPPILGDNSSDQLPRCYFTSTLLRRRGLLAPRHSKMRCRIAEAPPPLATILGPHELLAMAVKASAAYGLPPQGRQRRAAGPRSGSAASRPRPAMQERRAAFRADGATAQARAAFGRFAASG